MMVLRLVTVSQKSNKSVSIMQIQKAPIFFIGAFCMIGIVNVVYSGVPILEIK